MRGGSILRRAVTKSGRDLDDELHPASPSESSRSTCQNSARLVCPAHSGMLLPAELSPAGRGGTCGHPCPRRAGGGVLAQHLVEPVREVRKHTVHTEGDQVPHFLLLVYRVGVNV